MKGCEEVQQAIQERLDGAIEADGESLIDAHLAGCAPCREFQDGLLAVRQALRSLPRFPMPAEALDGVWSRTVHSKPRRAALDWRFAAAAAAVLTLAFLPALLRPVPEAYSAAELTRAAEDARIVFAVTTHALERTEHAAVDQVLAGRVSPALRRIPVRFPAMSSSGSRRSRT